jgi:hypothetical protein
MLKHRQHRTVHLQRSTKLRALRHFGGENREQHRLAIFAKDSFKALPMLARRKFSEDLKIIQFKIGHRSVL